MGLELNKIKLIGLNNDKQKSKATLLKMIIRLLTSINVY